MASDTTRLAFDHYLTEYMWWRAVRACQSKFRTEGLPSYESTGDPYVIFKSEARGRLHEKMEATAARLHEQYLADPNINVPQDLRLDMLAYKDAIVEVIRDRVKIEGVSVEDVFSSDFAGTPTECRVAFETMCNNGILPLSPYDREIGNKEAFALMGTRLGGISLQGIQFSDDGRVTPRSMMRSEVLFDSSQEAVAGGSWEAAFQTLYDNRSLMYSAQKELGVQDRPMPMRWQTLSDEMGLTPLACEFERYPNGFSHVANQIMNWPGYATEDGMANVQVCRDIIRPQVDAAMQVLDYLNERGLDWTFCDGDRPGQLSIEIVDTASVGSKIHVRIIDLDEPSMVGRVRIGDVLIYRTAIPQAGMSFKSDQKAFTYPPVEPSYHLQANISEEQGEAEVVSFGREEVLMPLRHALGEPTYKFEAPDARGIRNVQFDDDGFPEYVGTSPERFEDYVLVERRDRNSGQMYYTLMNPSMISKSGIRQTYALAASGQPARTLYTKKDKMRSTNTFFVADAIGDAERENKDPLRYIEQSVQRARETWENALDLDTVIHMAELARAEGLSSYQVELLPSRLDGLQKSYLQFLLGETDALLCPEGRPAVDDFVPDIETFFDDDAPAPRLLDEKTGEEWLNADYIAASMDVSLEEARVLAVREHAREQLEAEIGTVAPQQVIENGEVVTRTFNPYSVALWGSGASGIARVQRDMVSAVSILENEQDSEGKPYIDRLELRGVDKETGKGTENWVQRFIDGLTSFDESSAQSLIDRADAIGEGPEYDFWMTMQLALMESLEAQGVRLEKVEVDDMGILHWEGSYADKLQVFEENNLRFSSPEEAREALEKSKAKAEGRTVWKNRRLTSHDPTLAPRVQASGVMGPFFPPDEHGVVRCKFAGSEDFAFVPAMDLRLDKSEAHRDQFWQDRAYAIGYTQKMAEAVRQRAIVDCLTVANGDHVVGDSMSLVTPLRHAASTHRYGYDFARDLDRKLYYDEHYTDEAEEIVGHMAACDRAKIDTESLKVNLQSRVKDSAGPQQAFNLMTGATFPGDDTFPSDFNDMGNRSGEIKADQSLQRTDPVGTGYTGLSQISSFYLVDGVEVDPETGRMDLPYVQERDENGDVIYEETALLDDDGEPVLDENGIQVTTFAPKLVLDANGNPIVDIEARTPLLDPNNEVYSSLGKYSRMDAPDRTGMAFKNFIHGQGTTLPVNCAIANLSGWTQDDAIVISEEFAKTYVIETENGPRALRPGDKLCDLHGNKGVISMVVPEVDEPGEEISESVRQVREFFRANPGLSAVFSPYSPLSRLNPGLGLESMDKGASELVVPGQGVIPGGMTKLEIIITDKPVDEKSKLYLDEDYKKGKGRKVSAQFGQILASKGAEAIADELFGRNSRFVPEFKEKALACGVYVDNDTTVSYITNDAEGAYRVLGKEYVAPKPGAIVRNGQISKEDTVSINERKIIAVTPADIQKTSNGRVHYVNSLKRVNDLVASSGGTLLIPFPLNLNDKCVTPEVTNYVDLPEGWPEGVKAYGLPLESISLREETEMTDNGPMLHPHTGCYADIIEASLKWFCSFDSEVTSIDGMKLETDEDRARARGEICIKAQTAYKKITNDLDTHYFAKAYKEGAMSVRQPNSATAVWMPNPDLKLDELAMGPDMAKSLGVKENEQILVWRDPLLRTGGLRSMTIKVIDNMQEGVAIHPASAYSFDGDFDGDTVGLVPLRTPAAQKEAREKFSHQANFFDIAAPLKELKTTGEKCYRPYFNTGLDIEAAFTRSPELREKHDQIVSSMYHFVVEIEKQDEEKDVFANQAKAAGKPFDDPTYLGPEGREKLRQEHLDAYSDVINEALVAQGHTALDVLDFETAKSWIKSVYETSVLSAKKGSLGAVDAYAKSAGMVFTKGSVECLETGEDFDVRIDPNAKPDMDMIRATQEATAIKTRYTGAGGRMFQLGMEAYADLSPDAANYVCELTRQVTQALLQAKHDAKQALALAGFVQEGIRHLWQGHEIVIEENQFGLNIKPVTVVPRGPEDGVFDEPGGRGNRMKCLHCLPEVWAANLMEIYDSLGVGVNPEIVEGAVEAFKDRLAHTMDENHGKYRKGQAYVVGVQTQEVEGQSVEKNKAACKCYDPQALYVAAENHDKLFDTSNYWDRIFAPASVKEVQAAEQEPEKYLVYEHIDGPTRIKGIPIRKPRALLEEPNQEVILSTLLSMGFSDTKPIEMQTKGTRTHSRKIHSASRDSATAQALRAGVSLSEMQERRQQEEIEIREQLEYALGNIELAKMEQSKSKEETDVTSA